MSVGIRPAQGRWKHREPENKKDRMEKAPALFLCDVMLGRLARWLRTLGFDTAYDAGAADDDLLARAAREGRVLLTRDSRLAPRPGMRLFLLQAHEPLAQLRELIVAIDGFRPPGLFSRCLRCNTTLRRAHADQVAEKVPDFIRAAHATFLACQTCGRVYWAGTHRRAMHRTLEGLLPDLRVKD